LEIANWKVQIENFIFPIFIFQLFYTFFDSERPLTRGANGVFGFIDKHKYYYEKY